MAYLIDNHPALGTTWWVEIFGADVSNSETIRLEIITAIAHFEARYSRFIDSSLISTLNRERVVNAPDQDMIAILTAGVHLYSRTSGHFNVLLGETLEARGYDAHYRFTAVPEPATMPSPLRDIVITPDYITLRQGKVDLGGFAKGYLIDQLATILKNHGVAEFLVNGGGDIYGTSENGTPITIHLEHPTEPGTIIGSTTIYNQGFAASSPFKRAWVDNGIPYNHIVGLQAELLTSYVIAKTASDADAFATTALLATDNEINDFVRTAGVRIGRYNPVTQSFSGNNFPFSARL